MPIHKHTLLHTKHIHPLIYTCIPHTMANVCCIHSICAHALLTYKHHTSMSNILHTHYIHMDTVVDTYNTNTRWTHVLPHPTSETCLHCGTGACPLPRPQTSWGSHAIEDGFPQEKTAECSGILCFQQQSSPKSMTLAFTTVRDKYQLIFSHRTMRVLLMAQRH